MKTHHCFLIFSFLIFLTIGLNAQCIKGDCANGKGTYKFPSGAIYTGDFKDGKFHGYGICEYSDGERYEGWWVDRLQDGKGTLYKTDGTKVSGLWKKGFLIDEGGEVIDTEFAHKRIEGGEIQIGCLKGDCKNGYGIMACPNGDRYEGEFKEGKFHGKCKWFYSYGDVFDGYYEDNFPHGKGKIYHVDKTVTEGIWEKGTFLGESKDIEVKDCTDGTCGNIKNGLFNYADGTTYQGEFKNGIPEGWGRVEYSSGEIYEGDWKNGSANGYGIFTDKRGNEYSGIWKNGSYVHQVKKEEPETVEVIENELEDNGKTKVWAVVVGVSMYSHMRPLKYSDNDAFRLMAFMQSPAGGALPDEQIRVLVDEDATKENIINSMKELYGKADKNDLIILYFSGHGLKGSFLPIDYDGYRNELKHSEINKILEKSKAKYKLCIADACHSGSYAFAEKGELDDIISDYYTNLSNSRAGTALMLSSKPEETSLESYKVRQGVFSHYLLRGMKGEADQNNNGIVTLKELYTYIAEKVISYTQFRQSPVLKGNYDSDMPISVVRKK